MNDYYHRALLVTLDVGSPSIDPDAFLAEGVRISGDVTVMAGASIWYNAVLRADLAPIVIGERTNVQDNVTIHVDAGVGTFIGDAVSIGHNAVVHGCAIGSGTLVGMGATVLTGASLGKGCLVAAGAVVLEHAEFPAQTLVAGVPARAVRKLTAEETERILANAERYEALSALHGGKNGQRPQSRVGAVTEP